MDLESLNLRELNKFEQKEIGGGFLGALIALVAGIGLGLLAAHARHNT